MPFFDKNKCVKCGSCVRSCPMGVLRLGDDGPETIPGRRCISCMHCAAICPMQAVGFDGIPNEELYIPTPETELEQIVKTRRSVRHFRRELPPWEDIKWALDTAEWAPSGKNAHANGWSVIWGREKTDEVTDIVLDWCEKTGEAKELIKIKRAGTNLITCDAPVVIVGWSPDDALNPVVDTIVAMTTVDLLLRSRGISSCWGGYLNQISNSSPDLRRWLGIPEGCHMRCGLMVGYDDAERYRNTVHRPEATVNRID